jgi:hypothetical protein
MVLPAVRHDHRPLVSAFFLQAADALLLAGPHPYLVLEVGQSTLVH